MQLNRLGMTMVLTTAAVLSAAQDSPPRAVDNPFQGDRAYTVGDEMVPDVDIEGVWWTLLRVAPNAGKDPERGVDTTVVVDVRFDNRSKRNARLSVVLLLEDQDGNQLERLKFPGLKLTASRVREFTHKFTVPGEDLIATRRVYLFCQVE